jgi:hypothetical protein
MTEEQGAVPVSAKIVSGDSVVLDASVPASSLVRAPADVHLRLHMQQLAALAIAEREPPVAQPVTA